MLEKKMTLRDMMNQMPFKSLKKEINTRILSNNNNFWSIDIVSGIKLLN